jgi:hypothetical protein
LRVQEQTLELLVEIQEVCVFAVYKSTEEIVPLPVDDDVVKFIEEFVVKGFLRTVKHVSTSNLREDASSLQLTRTSGDDFCSRGFQLAKTYSETIRSRTAMVVTVRFKLEGRRYVGFFQLRDTAVMALVPHRQELKVVEQAFRRFEKAFVVPSLVKEQQVSVYQRSHSDYFEGFVGVDKPLTPEEKLAEIVRVSGIETLSELLKLTKPMPEAGQARVRLELLDTKTVIRLDQVRKHLGIAGASFVLVEEGPEAYIRVGRRKLRVDSEQLRSLEELLKERSLA